MRPQQAPPLPAFLKISLTTPLHVFSLPPPRSPFDFVDGKRVFPEFAAAQAAGAFPMGQVPVLEVTKDGKTAKLAQSKAIARYVAGVTGLLGATPELSADIDSVCELVGDISKDSGDAKTEEDKAKFMAEGLPKKLATLEALLGEGFAVGGKLSQADVFLYHLATHALGPSAFGPGNPPAQEALKASPKVGAIIRAVAANNGVAAWEAARSSRGEAF